jgi:hypothetical protein
MSLIESIINIVVGFGISLGAQVVFLPMLGVAIDFRQNLVFALIMTVISIVRSYLLRRLFEAFRIHRPLSPFMQAVIAERWRQIDAEGWDLAHDDDHPRGVLARAGGAYLANAGAAPGALIPERWPWADEWWKPTDFRRNLVKGTALAIAEGEKFDRRKTKFR